MKTLTKHSSLVSTHQQSFIIFFLKNHYNNHRVKILRNFKKERERGVGVLGEGGIYVKWSVGGVKMVADRCSGNRPRGRVFPIFSSPLSLSLSLFKKILKIIFSFFFLMQKQVMFGNVVIYIYLYIYIHTLTLTHFAIFHLTTWWNICL